MYSEMTMYDNFLSNYKCRLSSLSSAFLANCQWELNRIELIYCPLKDGNSLLTGMRNKSWFSLHALSTGRQFFKCQSGGCNFFLWSEENTENTSTPGLGNTGRNNTSPSFGGGFDTPATGPNGMGDRSSGYGTDGGDQGSSTNVWGEVMCQCNAAAVQ